MNEQQFAQVMDCLNALCIGMTVLATLATFYEVVGLGYLLRKR